MSESPHIAISMLSNPLFLSGTRELVANVARRMGFSEEACGQMALAVDEALCNVIRHGYAKRADMPIWVSLYAVGGLSGPDDSDGPQTEALKIVIEDEARQVDLGTIKSRDLDEIRPGGLGVHIIREVMDEVRYEHREPKGMRLIMIKKRTGAPAQPAAPSEKAN